MPTAEYYNRLKGTRNWRADGVISVAIGQGEIGATPLQLANLATIIANRGWYIDVYKRQTIYDAEGRLLAWWRPVYNLSIIPFELEPFDTIKLANLLELTQEQLTSRIEKAKKMGGYQPITIYEDLSDFVVSYLYEHESEYKGILLEKRFMRDYPLKIGAHFLGYISAVSYTHLN